MRAQIVYLFLTLTLSFVAAARSPASNFFGFTVNDASASNVNEAIYSTEVTEFYDARRVESPVLTASGLYLWATPGLAAASFPDTVFTNSTAVLAAPDLALRVHVADVDLAGDGATSDVPVSSSITNAQAVALLVAGSRIQIDSKVTIPSDITVLRPDVVEFAGGSLQAHYGVLVTVPGPIYNYPLDYIFQGEGTFRLLGRYARAEWFGAVGDATLVSDKYANPESTRNGHVMRKIHKALNFEGGTAEFGPGVFNMDDETQAYLDTIGGWTPHSRVVQLYETIDSPRQYFTHSYLHVKGVSSTETVFTCSRERVYEGVGYAPYRSAGWSRELDNMFTYVDDLDKGKTVLTLRVASESSRLRVGNKVFINAGSSAWDQDFGMFNIIEKIDGPTVHLKWPINKEFRVGKASSIGQTTADFVMPAVGARVTVQLSIDPRTTYADYISIGNDLFNYEEKTSTGGFVFENLGKGNLPPGTVIPAGTETNKYRAMVVAESANIGSTVSDFKVYGFRKTVNVSNTISPRIERIHGVHNLNPDTKGGFWIDGDGGIDCLIFDSEFECINPTISQFARSYALIRYERCTFRNAQVEASEFNSQFELIDCRLFMDYTENPDKVRMAIKIDESTGDCTIAGNHIWATNVTEIFSGQGIKSFTNTAGGNLVIRDNQIYAYNCGYIFDLPTTGPVLMTNNVVQGRFRWLFLRTPYRALNGIYGTSTGRYSIGSTFTVDNLKVYGDVDGVFSRFPMSIEGNIEVVRHDFYTPGGGRARATGDIISEDNGVTGQKPHEFNLDLKLWNWDYSFGNNLNYSATLGYKQEARIEFRNSKRTRTGGTENFSATVSKTGVSIETED